MLKDLLGREIKVDDLICVSSARGGSELVIVFGRVLKLTPKTFQYMMLHNHSDMNIFPNIGSLRRGREGDIFRCPDPKRAMIVNGIDNVDQQLANELTFKEAGFQRFDEGK